MGEEAGEKVGIVEEGGGCKISIIFLVEGGGGLRDRHHFSTVHNQRKTLIQIAHLLGSDRKAPVV